MPSTLTTPPTSTTLEALHADANRNRNIAPLHPENPNATPLDRFTARAQDYMAIGPHFGQLLYSLIRSSKAKTVVEFGTSFGISTIYLAAALRDNGTGHLITTEFLPEKAATAKQNLTNANLVDLIDFRIGDALQTLAANTPATIDLLFLDGAKEMYIDILKLLEPRFHPRTLIASDNTDSPALIPFLHYLRTSPHYTTSAIFTGDANHPRPHEISVFN